MTTAIPTTSLVAAATALATAMPSSVLPIGPQLEAWVLLTLGGSLQAMHVTVMPVPTGTFYIRLNQHKTFKGLNTSWLQFSYRGKSYEIHNALQIQGVSGAHHEVDVCVIRGKPAYAPVGWRDFRAGIECKQLASPIAENAVRTIIGINVEFLNLPLWRWPCYCWAVASTNFGVGENTQALLDYYSIQHVNIDTSSVTHVHPSIDTFAKRLLVML